MTFENNEIHVSFTHKIFIVISLVITKKGNHRYFSVRVKPGTPVTWKITQLWKKKQEVNRSPENDDGWETGNQLKMLQTV